MMKICNVCKEPFYPKNPAAKTCSLKSCQLEKNRRYYEKNKKKVIERNKIYNTTVKVEYVKIRCLKCDKIFESENRVKNRICLACTNSINGRNYLCESDFGGIYHI